jgi:hypothetical protein
MYMDEANRESLIRDIILLDPSLEAHEAELRMLVSELVSKKPTVEINDVFRTSLRARILTRPKKSSWTAFDGVAWWASRLIPVGALALLLIILVPGDILHAPEEINDSADLIGDAALDPDMIAEKGVRDTFSSEMALMESSPQPDASFGYRDAPVENGLSMKMAREGAPSDPFIVSPQIPSPRIQIDSITTEFPVFAVVYSSKSGGEKQIEGVSPLILPGTTSSVPIYTRIPTRAYEEYTITLHRDNGDRIFNPNRDSVLFDSFGNEKSMMIIIQSEGF